MRISLLLLLLGAATASADVRLPRLLSDGVVLQRDARVSVWGLARDGEAVIVELDGKRVAGARAEDGRWRTFLPEQPAGGPHELTVRGDNTLTVHDVWFGDVWVAGGQSNMELSMARIRERFADDVAQADNPLIRQFDVPRAWDFDAPREDLDGGAWVASTPQTVLDFSAVAWFFARELNERYDVPIGILSSNYGGSTAEGWMSEAALEAFPEHLEIARRFRDDRYLQSLLDTDRRNGENWRARLDERDAGLAGEWQRPGLDDTAWDEAQLPGTLAEQTDLENFSGAVWFRRELDIPVALAGEAAELELGRLVDADVAWVNGVKVGETTYQYPPRRYQVPPGVLEAGRNVIAVRLVVNGAEPGGFVKDKPYELRVGGERIELAGAWRYRAGAAVPPLPPLEFVDYKQPLGFYNAMLAPITNMTIKGVIWYQGESNVGRAAEYRRLFPAMIEDWRRQWGQGDFPFLFVQLANFLAPADAPVESAWAELREAQRRSLAVPQTAMAVAIDVGVWNDIHPEDKKTVGHRLALAARKLVYGETDLVASGPTFRSLDRNDNRLVVTFADTGGGLVARNGPLDGFAVGDASGEWHRASARIDGETVIVSSEAVPAPAAVRYAWADNPVRANLYNRAGLPASPFEASLSGPEAGSGR